MVMSMMQATTRVGYAMLLLCLAIYSFAVVMHTLLSKNPGTGVYWSTMQMCMSTLLCNGVFGDSMGTVLRLMMNENEFLAIVFFLLFVVIATITLINMLVGVLCEAVGEAGQARADQDAIEEMQTTIIQQLKVHDNGQGQVSKEDLEHLLRDADAIACLARIHVDIGFLVAMKDVLLMYHDSTIAITSIVDLMLSCRENAASTVYHTANGFAVVEHLLSGLERRLSQRMSLGLKHGGLHRSFDASIGQ
jgi:hypothetical protein